MDYKSIMRVVLWEEIKGKLNALMHTYDANDFLHPDYSWGKMKEIHNKFIEDFESEAQLI